MKTASTVLYRKISFVLLSLSIISLSSIPAFAQMVTGKGMKNYNDVFKLDSTKKNAYEAVLFESNAAGNIFFPGEKPKFSFQIQNKSGQPLKGKGKADFLAYGTRGIPGDIWKPEVFKIAVLEPIAIEFDIPAKGWQNCTIEPKLPETMGGYALVVDLGDYGRQFLTGMVRTFEPDLKRIQFPKQSLEDMPGEILKRLNIKAIRYGVSYYPTESEEYKEKMKWLDEQFKDMNDNFVTCVVEIGAGPAKQPLGRGRPHLDEQGKMIGGKEDLAWLPQWDQDYKKFVYDLLCQYGWPKGPVTGIKLWNEPWEGLSISGWGADMLRYRELYKVMGEAVFAARKDAHVDVLVGGCDSSANTIDKLFSDGSNAFLPYLDFCSIHYQGLSSPCLYPQWNNRKDYKGRVLIWDTESWVANTDDRFAGVVAANRAAGYDRAMGVFGGNVSTVMSHNQVAYDTIFTETESIKIKQLIMTWPLAASVGASQHFIGERNFKEILFQNGLPWVFVFDGNNNNQGDGTIVVVGDIDSLFDKGGALYHTVRGQDEVKAKIAAKKQIEKQAKENPEQINSLQKQLRKDQPFSNVKMSLDAAKGNFGLYDFYGNPVLAKDGKITIPLDNRGFFLRTTDNKPESFSALLTAIKNAKIEGLEPLEMIPFDFTEPIGSKPSLRIKMTNMLNTPLNGKLKISFDNLKTARQVMDITFEAREEKEITVAIEGKSAADNTYPLWLEYDAGQDGAAIHQENLHVNWISKKSITVDGKLEDWQDALPQIIQTDESASRSFQDEAWMPFRKFDASVKGGFAMGYLAYDENNFYFAAKINDDSVYPGTVRFETQDENAAFYPDVSYDKEKELRWPEDVRHFSYRRWPDLPSGQPARPVDNVLIAFNAIPLEKDDWLTSLPGRMPKFVWYKCTDYEFALNKVAEEFGGGTEIWKLQSPGMPFKHFFPRQPKYPSDGPVKDGQLVIVHEGNTRIVETAIPWSAIPHVKKLMDEGKTVKFSYRVNNDKGGPTMELAKDRSVSKINNQAFHPNWEEHWANEVEFGFEK